MNLWTAFLLNARDHAARPAVVSRHGAITFKRLLDAAETCSVRLAACGVREGDLVAISIPNETAFAVAILALSRLGATIALVPPKFGLHEWESLRSAAGPWFVVTTESTRLSCNEQEFRWERVHSEGGALRVGAPFSDASKITNVALIKFTSGSAGTPKGIGLTTENVAAEAGNILQTLELHPGARIGVPVPITHSYGFDLGFLPMVYGGVTIELHENFNPPQLCERLAQSELDVFLGVPSMYHFLAEATPTPAPRFSNVRYLLSCTAPLSESLITRFRETFDAVICQHYGSSETGAVATHLPSEVLARPGSVGRAMHGVEIEIRDNDGRSVGAGTEGEIFVRGPAVASRYVALAPSRADSFRDGGFYTGDLGRLDADGFLDVTGRRDEMINVAGFKVSPLEVKRTLENFAPIREAAVFGVDDVVTGQIVHALVSLKAAATEASILAYCRSILSDHKVPRRIEIVADLPRGATGKVKLGIRENRP